MTEEIVVYLLTQFKRLKLSGGQIEFMHAARNQHQAHCMALLHSEKKDRP
jgi:hypothetical protein